MNEIAIDVREVEVCFPLVRFRAGGIKEAFLRAARRTPRAGPTEFWALKGVTLQVKRGEVVGLLGKNGSGKSTLLRVIAGIYEPDRGEVRVEGRISALLELGAGFRDELNGLENIRLAGAVIGLSPLEIESQIEDIERFADIGEFIHQPLRTYSSGMRARLGFAVASSVRPDVLLIDEALAVGDAQFRERSMLKVEEMVKSGITVVIVSHNLGELERLCHRLVLINAGKVLGSGPPQEMLAEYKALTTLPKPAPKT